MLWFHASCCSDAGRLLIALLALSAPPSDCLFCPRPSPLQRLLFVLDFARLLSDFFFTFPFIAPSTFLTQDIVGSLVWAPFQPPDTHGASPRKAPEKPRASSARKALSDFFCISELLRCLCRKDPLITFYWAVRLWPSPIAQAGLAKVREGTFLACPGLGNGLLDSTSFGSLCPIRSPLTPVLNTRPSSTMQLLRRRTQLQA